MYIVWMAFYSFWGVERTDEVHHRTLPSGRRQKKSQQSDDELTIVCWSNGNVFRYWYPCYLSGEFGPNLFEAANIAAALSIDNPHGHIRAKAFEYRIAYARQSMGIVTNLALWGTHRTKAPHRGVGATALAGCNDELSSQHQHFLAGA